MKRGVLVGYGVIAEGHADGYDFNPGLQIASIVDKTPSRRIAGLRRFPYASAYGTIEEALDAEGLDFVDICTPPASHSDILAACLERDLFVICEKPLVCSGEEAMRLMEQMGTSSGTVYPAHNYAFAPGIRRLNEVCTSTVGEVQSATFEIRRVGHARGVSEWRPNWRRELEVSGGGIVLDHGPHSIYLASRLLGRSPSAVRCVLSCPTLGAFTDTEDEARLLLEFGAVTVEILLTWRADRRSTSYKLCGAHGEVALDGDTIKSVQGSHLVSESIPSEFDDPRHGNWFAALLNEASGYMERRERPERLLSEALSIMAVLDAAYLSASENGRRVEF